MDRVSRDKRSAIMASIKCKDTAPEMALRRYLHGLGFRYRLHGNLPGKPDLVFRRAGVAVFVNGCFWHGHGCRRSNQPKTNSDYWVNKIAVNINRDVRSRKLLEKQGWTVFTIWECEIEQDIVDAAQPLVDCLERAREGLTRGSTRLASLAGYPQER